MSNMSDAVGLRLPYGKANSQFETAFEPATGTIWGYMNPEERPCFSLGLLRDIRAHDNALASNRGQVNIDDETYGASYYVLASRKRGIFNLGGDLALFALLIKTGDRDALAHYARLCIDNLYPRMQNFFCPNLTTISLVQGDALGGGLECALSSNIIIAEESAQLGLPEVLFNLFPGMGALSQLTRRIGMRAAEEFILSGRTMPAAEMHACGIVDVLAKDGEGEAATRDWISRNAKRQNAVQALFRARQFVHPITRQELDSIADLWVEAAFRLRDRDLKMMNRLVRSQVRRMESGHPVASDNIEEPATEAVA
jgi:DSF synthase